MRNKRLSFSSAIVVLLLSLSNVARADDACEALKKAYMPSVHGVNQAHPDAKALGAKLQACRSRLYGSSARAAVRASDAGAVYTVFDIPGSPGVPQPTVINAAGVIAGYYLDAGNLFHSFVRYPNGAVTTFDPPGATCSVSTSNSCSTVNGINDLGVISGSYQDAIGAIHGFLRTPKGTFTQIDVPGSNNFSISGGINLFGTVVGGYFDSASVFRGFLRRFNAIYTTFDPPDSTYTQADAINLFGVVSGSYQIADGSFHGFLRNPDGRIVTFEPPVGLVTNYPPTTINAEGTIAGTACVGFCDTVHGFLRARNGARTNIDAPGNNYGTSVSGINLAGETTGWFIAADFSAQHGFLRTRQGRFIVFDPPGAGGFTMPMAINDSGTITGTFCDASFTSCHAFVRTQRH